MKKDIRLNSWATSTIKNLCRLLTKGNSGKTDKSGKNKKKNSTQPCNLKWNKKNPSTPMFPQVIRNPYNPSLKPQSLKET